MAAAHVGVPAPGGGGGGGGGGFEGGRIFACEEDYAVTPYVAEFWSVLSIAVGGVAGYGLLGAAAPSGSRARAMYVLLLISSLAAAHMHATATVWMGPGVQVPIAVYAVLLLDAGLLALAAPRVLRLVAAAGASAVLASNGVFTSKTLFLPAAMAVIGSAGACLAIALAVRRPRGPPPHNVSHFTRFATVAGVTVPLHAALFVLMSSTDESCEWARAIGRPFAEAVHALEHVSDYFANHLLISLASLLTEREATMRWAGGVLPLVARPRPVVGVPPSKAARRAAPKSAKAE